MGTVTVVAADGVVPGEVGPVGVAGVSAVWQADGLSPLKLLQTTYSRYLDASALYMLLIVTEGTV